MTKMSQSSGISLRSLQLVACAVKEQSSRKTKNAQSKHTAAKSAPPLSVTDSAIAPSARMD